jgi:hypothetical protein
MSKMGLHDPFGHLNHKLWPKERPKSKFDPPPLKVGNHPNFLACKWHATYCWKAFNKGYNFASNLISIRGLHTKLWPRKIMGVPTLGILGFPLGSPGTKCHLGASLVTKHKVYYNEERWWLPPSSGRGESCESEFARGSS